MTCKGAISHDSEGASSSTLRDHSLAPALRRIRLRRALASASSGLVSSLSSRTALAASSLPSFSKTSDSRMTPYSPRAVARRMLCRASLVPSWSADSNLARSNHASPLSGFVSIAFSTDSSATGISPSMSSFAARSIQPAEVSGSVALGSTSRLTSLALSTMSDSSAVCRVVSNSTPRPSSLRWLRVTLSSSLPESSRACSLSTETSSGSTASSLSRLRSRAFMSPSSL